MNQVGQHYEELDGLYDLLVGEDRHHGFYESGREDIAAAAVRMKKEIASLAEVSAGNAVLDLGCGTGALLRFLRKRCPQADFTGIDLAAREGEGMVKGDFLKWDFGKGNFDRIMCVEALEHFADHGEVFAKCRRLLRGGGTMTLGLWCPAGDLGGVEHWMVGWVARCGCMAGFRDFGRVALSAEAQGLRVESVRELREYVAPSWEKMICRAIGSLGEPRVWGVLCRGLWARPGLVVAAVFAWVLFEIGALEYRLVRLVR